MVFMDKLSRLLSTAMARAVLATAMLIRWSFLFSIARARETAAISMLALESFWAIMLNNVATCIVALFLTFWVTETREVIACMECMSDSSSVVAHWHLASLSLAML